MKKYIKQIIFLAVMIACILFENKAYAAGGFVIGTSKSEINKGESFTLTISANNAYGQVNITADNATVSPNTVFLENNTKKVTVTSTNSNDISIVVSPAKSGLGDQDERPITTSQGAKVKVKTTSSNNNSNSNSNTGSGENNSGTTQTNQGTSTNQASSNQSNSTQTKSSVAILGNLGIKPNDFSGFTPNKTSYSTTVPNSVSSIEIYAVSPQNQKQTISGTGKKQLKEGQNNFEIKVTAEDGKTTKTYKLTVTREKSNSLAGEETTENTVESNDVTENNNEEQNGENIESDEQKIGLSELKIEGLKLSPEFKKDVYEYNTKLEDDKESVEIVATPITEGSKVDITGNENLKDGENTATYQITVTKEKKQENIVNLTCKIIKENFVIVILAVAILIVIIILIVHLIKNKNSVYSGIYMPYEEGVTEHEDIHQNEFKKEKKNRAKMKKSKGKRFK